MSGHNLFYQYPLYDVKNVFLIELKEQKIIWVDWIQGENNKAKTLSKNATGAIFDKFSPDFAEKTFTWNMRYSW